MRSASTAQRSAVGNAVRPHPNASTGRRWPNFCAWTSPNSAACWIHHQLTTRSHQHSPYPVPFTAQVNPTK